MPPNKDILNISIKALDLKESEYRQNSLNRV